MIAEPWRPPSKHVDDAIDQGTVDDEQPVIVPLLGLEHCKHGWERQTVEVIPESQRLYVVDLDFDIVAGEIAQGTGKAADQAVENDLEHRQTLVGDEPGLDDALHAGLFAGVDGTIRVTQQAVDLGLAQNPCGLGGSAGQSPAGVILIDFRSAILDPPPPAWPGKVNEPLPATKAWPARFA